MPLYSGIITALFPSVAGRDGEIVSNNLYCNGVLRHTASYSGHTCTGNTAIEQLVLPFINVKYTLIQVLV